MDEMKQIHRLEERRCRALQDNDVVALLTLLHSEFVYVHGSGRAESRADYLRSIADPKSVVTAFEHDQLEIRRIGDIALMTGILAHTKADSDTQQVARHLRFRFSSVWAAVGDSDWQLVLWHNTKILPRRT